MSNNLSGKEIDEMFKGTLKIVTKDYAIYKRDWLEENLDREAELIRNNSESLRRYIRRELMAKIREENDAKIFEMFNEFKSKNGCIGCSKKNCNGFSKSCSKFVNFMAEKYKKENKDESTMDEIL